MELNGQNNSVSQRACLVFLDDALVQAYAEPGFKGVYLPDGTQLPTLRSAIIHVLTLDGENGNGDRAVLESLSSQLTPVVRCRVSSALGNAPVWRTVYSQEE